MNIWIVIILFLLSGIDIFDSKEDKKKDKGSNNKIGFFDKFKEEINEFIKEIDEDSEESMENTVLDESTTRPSEPVKRTYVGGREFREIFPKKEYTLEEIRQIESHLSEEEYLSHRHQIYELEEEAARKERYKQSQNRGVYDDISILKGLSDTQKMVVYKEILDRPLAMREHRNKR